MNSKIFISDVNVDGAEAERAVRSKRFKRLLPGVFVPVSASESEIVSLLGAHALRIVATAKEKSKALIALSDATVAGAGGIMVFNESVDRPKRKMWQGGLLVEMPLPPGVSEMRDVQRIVYASDSLGDFEIRAMTEGALLVSNFVARARLSNASDDYSSVFANAMMKKRAIDALVRQAGGQEGAERVLRGIGGLFGLKSADALVEDAFGAANSRQTDLDADALIYWHKKLVAAIRVVDAGIRITYVDRGVRLSLADRDSSPEMNPSFIASLMPEGVAAIAHAGHKVDDTAGDALDIATRGARLLSNIEVVRTRGASQEHKLTDDVISAKLQSFTSPQGEFLGGLNPERMVGSHSMVGRDPLAPIQSGHQEKMFAHLREDGVLCAAERGVPYTHMIKIAPPGPLCSISAMEWLGLTIFGKVGIPTEKFAIMRGRTIGAPPLLVVERFDIKQSATDGYRYISEDIWSALRSRSGKAKYQTDLVRDVAPLLNSIRSPENEASIKSVMLDTVITSWLIQNEDMHSKNISFLTKIDPSTGKASTELSPAYDVTVNAAHDIATGRSAMPINEKYIYTVKELAEFGAAIGLTKDEVFERIKTLSIGVKGACDDIQAEGVPACIAEHQECVRAFKVSMDKIAARCERAISQLHEDKRARDVRAVDEETLVFSPVRTGRF